MHRFWIFVFVFFSFQVCFSQDKTPLEVGIEAYENENWELAIRNLDNWLRKNPRDTEAFWIRGQAWEKLGVYENALADLNSLLTLDTENSEALFERGRVRYLLKQYDEALDDFEQFLLTPPRETNRVLFRIAPGDEGVSSVTTAQSFTPDMAYYHMGLCAIELQNFELALSYLELAAETNPEEPDYYSEIGKALARLGENMAAIESYEIALQLDPDHKPSKLGLASVKNGGDELLLEELNQLIASSAAVPQTYKQRGFYRMSHEDPSGAIEDFSIAIQKAPEDPESYFYRAKVHAWLKNWGKAEEDYSYAIDLESNNPEFFLARGQARYQSGKIEAALADFILTVLSDPDHASGHYHKGIAFNKMGKTSEACEEFKASMDLGMEEGKEAWKKICAKH
jgi:tetratricopeptide (TPR) repeat protein